MIKKRGIVVGILAGALMLSGCGSGSDAVTQDSSGNYVTECMAECDVEEQDVSYTVCLKVTADGDGTIVKVEDDGTTIPDGKDGAYKKAEALFDELAGKNADTISEVDTISGATFSSNAILDAVKDGLDAINSEIQGDSGK